MPRFRRAKKRYVRRTKSNFRRRSYGGARRFKKGVKRVVESLSAYRFANFNWVAVAIAAGVTNYSMVPVIPQGVAENGRVANQIRWRNFQINLTAYLNGVTVAGSPEIMRIYIVWPRKLSFNDAPTFISSTNFPLFGVMDQDNWIVWMDKTYVFQNNTNNSGGVRQSLTLRWNKRFPIKSQYASNSIGTPEKVPYIVFVRSPVIGAGITLNGYVKLSFKDL